MKPKKGKHLRLNRESIRVLGKRQLGAAAGAMGTGTCGTCVGCDTATDCITTPVDTCGNCATTGDYITCGCQIP
jgi:hypothetical protein